MTKTQQSVLVIGGGLSGLATTMRLCEQGCSVSLVSLTQAKRSHSVCAQGGINAAINLKEEGDSPLIHAYDTIKGGDFLGEQPPILEMCLSAPAIIEMMDRFGCPFNRTPEGNIDFRRFGGTLYHRTAFCGASTGQQLLYTLDEQVRRYETRGLVKRFEHHEFMRMVIDDEGRACGIVMIDLWDLKLEVVRADAVVIATGGPGFLFKHSTNSTICTGAANGRLYMQGLHYANGEFVQIHPSAIPGHDKSRLMSESIRGEGGRVWVYGDSTKTIERGDGERIPCGETGKPWFFLEELYPAFGNLVPRDIGAREILRVIELGLGVEGREEVYLDITHLPIKTLHKLSSVLEIYYKFTGEDPKKVPMRIGPAVHYSMGGLWVDWPAADHPERMERYRQMSNVPGCFVVGEAEYQYHGANRLGANSLLSCIFGGLVAGAEIPRYLGQLSKSSDHLPSQLFTQALAREKEYKKEIFRRSGKENVHRLHRELASYLVKHVSVKRSDQGLRRSLEKIEEIKERFALISLDDRSDHFNQTYLFASQFGAMLELALVITKGALLRNESRGSHFKPECPQRDDQEWLKTTIATYCSDRGEPSISYRPVETPYLSPSKRDYLHSATKKPQLSNLPPQISLPI